MGSWCLTNQSHVLSCVTDVLSLGVINLFCTIYMVNGSVVNLFIVTKLLRRLCSVWMTPTKLWCQEIVPKYGFSLHRKLILWSWITKRWWLTVSLSRITTTASMWWRQEPWRKIVSLWQKHSSSCEISVHFHADVAAIFQNMMQEREKGSIFDEEAYRPFPKFL